ncbi:MAG TPA: hypothetical protein VK278_01790 [Gaiellaceae bacterium]|nr:hypothetical protein [Gaiellaceae bacterium]
MRRVAVALAAVAVLGGCGGDGGGSGTDFKDVKPCLDKLALVAANKFTGTVTSPTGQVTTLDVPEGVNVVDWSADLAYRSAAAGANAAHLAFYKSADAAEEELKRAHDAAKNGSAAGATLSPNFRRQLEQAALVGKSVVLTWSSPPTAKQKQRVAACFDQSKSQSVFEL